MKSFIEKSILVFSVVFSITAKAQTAGTIPKFVTSTTFTNSRIIDNGTTVGIGGGSIPAVNPPLLYTYGGGAYFDIPNTSPFQGDGKARFQLNRSNFTSFENLLSFNTNGTYKWLLGMDNDGTDNFHVFGPGAVSVMNINSATGNVGVGLTNMDNAITKFQVNGDFTFGSATIRRKWRFITQNWLDNGKMFLTPDDASGNPDYTKAFTIDPSNGNFSFGQASGLISLTIGNAYGTSLFGTSYIGFNSKRNPSTGQWTSDTDGGNSGGGIILGRLDGSIVFSPTNNAGASTNYYDDATVWNRRTMEVKWNSSGFGQVAVGPAFITSGLHTNYRMSVDGKLVAKEIYVTNTGWADYVFDNDYQLMPLNSLENYIKTNNHLPNVPTTEDIMINGNNTGETDRILLEKVEELTLYIIQIEKRIKELEK